MKNFIQPGKVLTLTAPSGGVESGKLYIIGAAFGVACGDAAEGEAFDLDVSGGVFELAKEAGASGKAWTECQALYYDATAKLITGTATSNTKVGIASEAAVTLAAVGRVRLNATF